MFVPSGLVAVPPQPVRRSVYLPGGRSEAAIREGQIDEALVVRCRGGDERAFAEIVARHRGRVTAVAVALVRNRADADEVAQDTFLRAHRGLAGFRGDAALATWLRRIAGHVARDRCRWSLRRGRDRVRSMETEIGGEGTATVGSRLAATGPDPAGAAESSEAMELVAACLLRLGAGPRRLLEARADADESYDAIAGAAGICVGTVKSRLARARGQLRSLLAAAGRQAPAERTWASALKPLRLVGA